jgi:hypothetical protein
VNRSTRHVGPSPAEQVWFKASDVFYETLQRSGEQAVRTLAEHALKAITSAQGSKYPRHDNDESRVVLVWTDGLSFTKATGLILRCFCSTGFGT